MEATPFNDEIATKSGGIGHADVVPPLLQIWNRVGDRAVPIWRFSDLGRRFSAGDLPGKMMMRLYVGERWFEWREEKEKRRFLSNWKFGTVTGEDSIERER
ncbi:unnamed protein product [Linum trigynum]|uniref:Uncharacterized protein n=1 Tax=Linum trigynum TaxID=586398 RepID=A0AAV2E7Q8_9ROSI